MTYGTLGAVGASPDVTTTVSAGEPGAGNPLWIYGPGPYRRAWFNGIARDLSPLYTMNGAGQVFAPGDASGVAYVTEGAGGELVYVTQGEASARQEAELAADIAKVKAFPPGTIISATLLEAARAAGIPLYQRADGNWLVAEREGVEPPPGPAGPVAQRRETGMQLDPDLYVDAGLLDDQNGDAQGPLDLLDDDQEAALDRALNGAKLFGLAVAGLVGLSLFRRRR